MFKEAGGFSHGEVRKADSDFTVRPAEKTWTEEINQQSALEQESSTKNTLGQKHEQTVSMGDIKKKIIVHYYRCGYPCRVLDGENSRGHILVS